jgi:hypothetical protein
MVEIKESGLRGGSQHLGKGIERILVEVDKALGKAGAPVIERPSTWGNILGGALMVVAGAYVSKPLDEILTEAGWHMTTKVWDAIEEAMAAGAAAAAAGAGAGASFSPSPSPTGSSPAPRTGERIY